jgi:hypothetical protein
MIDTNTTPAASGQRHHTTSTDNEQTQTTPRQLDLIDHGMHAAKTRAIAAASAMPKAKSRRDAIELHVAGCGVVGATRWEIHEALRIPYTSVCSPVQELVIGGRLHETERTRLTVNGKPAAVLVSGLLPTTNDGPDGVAS